MSIADRTGLLTVEEYLKLAERDVFHDRVELIEGEIVSMSPQGVWHARIIMLLVGAFMRHSIPADRLAVGCTLRIDRSSALEPDLMVLAERTDFGEYYNAADALLVVEVSLSTTARDRAKLPLYASAGVPEVWLLLPEEGRLEIHSAPSPGGYQQRRELKAGDVLETAAVPGLRLAVGPLLEGREPTP
jgi:Uma2 family endonuclease